MVTRDEVTTLVTLSGFGQPPEFFLVSWECEESSAAGLGFLTGLLSGAGNITTRVQEEDCVHAACHLPGWTLTPWLAE